MSTDFKTAIVSDTGKTRLQASLERAQAGGAPSVGQWIEFPGYTLAKTVAGLGSDVKFILLAMNPMLTKLIVGVDRLRTWQHI